MMTLTANEVAPIKGEDLKSLVEFENDPCLTFYISTHEVFPETRQDPIRLKNLVAEAEAELTHDGMRGTEARDLLEPARDLLEDKDFWTNQDKTLALFLAAGELKIFRLPIEMKSRVGVDGVFHVIPLLRTAYPDTKFFVLSLNKGHIRLLEGSRYSIEEINLKEAPTSLQEFFADTQFPKSLQFHTTSTSLTKQGRRGAIHHGQGVQDEKNEKKRLGHFFERLDDDIRDFLPDPQTPLVLAGQPHILSLYREASHIKNLIEDEVDVNSENLKDIELHDRAWDKIEPILEEPKKRAQEKFLELAGKRSTKVDVRFEVVVPASRYQKVDTLFVPYDKAQWGLFDEETSEVALHAKRQRRNTELFNRMALNTFRYGGTVFPVESGAVPKGNEIAAILR